MAMSTSAPESCALCARPLGRRIEWHHWVPKSRGGREVAALHPICHRAIHAALGNKDLARAYASAQSLRGHPEIAKFLEWVANKPSDFHAPTFRKKG
jgi:hypothetical protein